MFHKRKQRMEMNKPHYAQYTATTSFVDRVIFGMVCVSVCVCVCVFLHSPRAADVNTSVNESVRDDLPYCLRQGGYAFGSVWLVSQAVCLSEGLCKNYLASCHETCHVA